MVSGTISLPCSGFFSPFLHSTRSLSVSREYLALPDGPGRFAQDSSCPALLRIPLCCISLHILDYHRLWSHFHAPTACRRTVSGTISLFCSKCFSPFPHGTGSLSVSREYLALPDGPGRFTQDSSCPALLRIPLRFVLLRIPDCHRLWSYFPECSARKMSCDIVVLQPRRCRNNCGLGSSPFARHYWGNHCYFLFLRVLRCFSSPRWLLTS